MPLPTPFTSLRMVVQLNGFRRVEMVLEEMVF
jgi:hypothetical protein